MKRKRYKKQIALLLALAILLSLFVAVAFLLSMSGCGRAGVAAGPAPTESSGPVTESTRSLTTTSTRTTTRTTTSRTSKTETSTPSESSSASPVKTSSQTTTPPTSQEQTSPSGTPIKPQQVGAVAITFDDGPGAYTAQLLDALKKNQVKVTFFVQGRFVNEHPDLIRRMRDEGHEVGNHSYSHQYLTRLDDAGLESQLSKTSDAIEAVLGSRPTLMRPPGAYGNARVFEEAARQGMAVVYWDIDTNDWRYKNSQYVHDYLINHTAGGQIVLLHDTHETTVEGFISALPLLIERGFTFVTVDELVSLNPGDVYPARWRR